MATLCGEPTGPDAVSLKVPDDRYSSEQAVRNLERRLKINAAVTYFLAVLVIILIAIVAWLGVSLSTELDQLNSTVRPSNVFFTKGKPTVNGYTAFGSLARGSGNWAVQPDPTPWGALSDHLVLTNETNLLLNGTNSVVILGGMDNNSIFSNKTWAYNGVYETYTRMPDMPVVRSRFAGAIGGGKIFVTGGYAGPNTLNDYQATVLSSNFSAYWQDNTLDVFNFATNTWSRNVAQSPIRRSDHCAAFINGKLYLVGGYDPSYNILNSTEVFDPATGLFSSTAIPALPEPRGDVGCNAVGSTLFVHGGYYDPTGQFGGGMHWNTTWAIDVSAANPKWVRKADMNWARGDHAFAVLSNGRLLVIGGENDPETINDKTPIRSVEMYNIADDVWSEKAPLVYARFRFSAGVVSSATTGDSAVFAFGGHELCLNTGTVYSTTSLAELQALNSCASKAADTLSVYSNLQHPDVYVYLQNGVAAGNA